LRVGGTFGKFHELADEKSDSVGIFFVVFYGFGVVFNNLAS